MYCFFGFEGLRPSNHKKKTTFDIYFKLCLICLPWIKWGASLLILFNPRRKSEGLRPSDLLKSELRAFGPRSDFRASLALPQEWSPTGFILSVFFVNLKHEVLQIQQKSQDFEELRSSKSFSRFNEIWRPSALDFIKTWVKTRMVGFGKMVTRAVARKVESARICRLRLQIMALRLW